MFLHVIYFVKLWYENVCRSSPTYSTHKDNEHRTIDRKREREIKESHAKTGDRKKHNGKYVNEIQKLIVTVSWHVFVCTHTTKIKSKMYHQMVGLKTIWTCEIRYRSQKVDNENDKIFVFHMSCHRLMEVI